LTGLVWRFQKSASAPQRVQPGTSEPKPHQNQYQL